MASVALSEAEKVYIVHGVQVAGAPGPAGGEGGPLCAARVDGRVWESLVAAPPDAGDAGAWRSGRRASGEGRVLPGRRVVCQVPKPGGGEPEAQPRGGLREGAPPPPPRPPARAAPLRVWASGPPSSPSGREPRGEKRCRRGERSDGGEGSV